MMYRITGEFRIGKDNVVRFCYRWNGQDQSLPLPGIAIDLAQRIERGQAPRRVVRNAKAGQSVPRQKGSRSRVYGSRSDNTLLRD